MRACQLLRTDTFADPAFSPVLPDPPEAESFSSQALNTSQSGRATDTSRDAGMVHMPMITALSGITLVALVLVVWATWPSRPPSPSDDPVALAKFVATSAFRQLPEQSKQPYMAAMRANASQIVEAIQGEQLTRKQYDSNFHAL